MRQLINFLILPVLLIKIIQSIAIDSNDLWEDVHMICPNQCVCQRSPYMDLSVSRWIQSQKGDKTHSGLLKSKQSDMGDDNDNDHLTAENENETFFEDDNSHLENSFIKFVMCMLQGSGNLKHLADLIPIDVQALVLLHNGNDNANYTIAASDLLQFNNLDTLEVRGTGSHRNLNLLMDEPLPMLKFVNFESIELIGDEQMKKKMLLSQHPSETYDYVPESERVTYNVSLEMEEEIKIVSYDVYRMEMQKSKEPTFYGWTNLNVLRIHKCQLDEVHWEMFDGLQNLQHLSLEHNDIKIIPPFAFYGALHIRSLSLAYNSILDLNYRSMAGLLDLEKLDLSYNNLTKLSEMSFPPFPHLDKIDLRHNPIRFIFPMTFGVMNTTKQMILGSDVTALELSIGSSFMALDHLTTLTLQNVSILILNQMAFKGLKNLQTLKMAGNVRRIEFDAFSEMPLLRELILSHCNIFEISMDAFYGIRNLEIINLSNNQLTFIPPGIFEDQRKLKEIYLQKNQLSILPMRFFDNPSVKLIRLTENPWICSCEMRTWRQAITNRVRSTRLSTAKKVCSIDPRTGYETCTDSDIHQYFYEFDNKMSPRCDGGPSEYQYRSVYYTLRHNIKCTQNAHDALAEAIRSNINNNNNIKSSYLYSGTEKETQHKINKLRIKHKYSMTMEKINALENHLNEHNKETKVTIKNTEIPLRRPTKIDRRQFRIDHKANRKQAFQNKIRNSLQLNTQHRNKFEQQVISNNINLGL